MAIQINNSEISIISNKFNNFGKITVEAFSLCLHTFFCLDNFNLYISNLYISNLYSFNLHKVLDIEKIYKFFAKFSLVYIHHH